MDSCFRRNDKNPESSIEHVNPFRLKPDFPTNGMPDGSINRKS